MDQLANQNLLQSKQEAFPYAAQTSNDHELISCHGLKNIIMQTHDHSNQMLKSLHVWWAS